MKIRYVISIAVLTLLAGIAYAGLVQPAIVDVDLDNMIALGDQFTARTSTNETEFIGCGTRNLDDGVNQFAFGLCQAEDSEGDFIVCFTQNSSLIDEIRGLSAYAFITFSWQDGGFGGTECTRVGFSTQSFYLPKK